MILAYTVRLNPPGTEPPIHCTGAVMGRRTNAQVRRGARSIMSPLL